MKPRARFSRLVVALLVAATGLTLAVVAAPLFALAETTRPLADALYSLFAFQCHQVADRSLHLAGEPLAVCARCTAIYSGLAGGSLLALRSARLRSLAWLLPVTALLVFVDVSFDGPLATRILTGALFGAGGAAALASFSDSRVAGLAAWGGRLATLLLLAAPLVACAQRQKKPEERQLAQPATPAAQACKEACNQAREACFADVEGCKRRCTPDKPATPYENEYAICARECEVKCQGRWTSCMENCQRAGQPPPAAAPTPQAPPTVIIQKAPGGCNADVDCKGDRICSDGRCVSPTPPAMGGPRGCASDADCKGDRICVGGRCESPQSGVAPQSAPTPEPPPQPAANREACDACAGACANLTTACNQGSISDCYRAGACMCRCRLAAGGCGVDQAELQGCITRNEEQSK